MSVAVLVELLFFLGNFKDTVLSLFMFFYGVIGMGQRNPMGPQGEQINIDGKKKFTLKTGWRETSKSSHEIVSQHNSGFFAFLF